MFTKEMFGFLLKVITSWQIIFITVILVIYFTLVTHVARIYHPRRSGFSFKPKPKKEKKKAAAVEAPESSEDDDDDLGIEQER